MNGPVVVGVDGSAGSLAALVVAAGEAALRHRPLRVVHAVTWPHPQQARGLAEAERLLGEGVECAREAAPGLAVRGALVIGAPAAVLRRESRMAELVVVGDRGLGGFTGLLVGSVAVQLAAHSECPILVVRGDPAGSGDVLLGVDGSSASEQAVEFAFQEADMRGAAITALHTWTHPASSEPGDMLDHVYDVDQVQAEESLVLAEALAGWQEKYPNVVVHRRVTRANPRTALIDASRRSRIVVVGARGRGGWTGMLLGSVSQAVLHHAGCPVAIVRYSARPPA
jgi:nucleotide-binding universal stress UspA family protein